jgi:hypothetical protein
MKLRTVLQNHDKFRIPIICISCVLFVLSTRLVLVDFPAIEYVEQNPVIEYRISEYDPLEYIEENSQEPRSNEQTKNHSMAFMILRLLGGRIDEGSHEAATICNHQLQRSGCGSLVMPRTVVGIPHQDRRDRTIHPRCHQESHPVLDFRIVDTDISYDGISDDSWD